MGKLSIRDETVNDLAEALVQLMGPGTNKTEAVRAALTAEITRIRSSVSLEDKIAAIQSEAAKTGLTRPKGGA